MRRLIFLLAMTLAAFSATAQEVPPLLKSVIYADDAAVMREANPHTVNQPQTIMPLSMAILLALVDQPNELAHRLRIIDILLDRGTNPNVLNALPLNSAKASVVDALVFYERQAARGADGYGKYDMKRVKAILAKLRAHGGVSDEKRIAAVGAAEVEDEVEVEE